MRRYFAIRSRSSSLASSPHRPRQVYCGSRLPTRFSCTVARPTHARPALRTSHFLFTLPRYVMCRYLTSRVQLRCAQPPRCSKVLCAHISRTHVPRATTLPPRASRPAFHVQPTGGSAARSDAPYTLPLTLHGCQAAYATASSLALGFLDPDSPDVVLPLHSSSSPSHVHLCIVLSVLRSFMTGKGSCPESARLK